jgi:hypothetical protein
MSDPSRPSSRSGSRAWIGFIILAALAAGVDLVTKSIAFARLGMPGTGERHDLVAGVLMLETNLNEGALFGMGQGLGLAFAGVSVLAIAGIVAMMLFASRRRPSNSAGGIFQMLPSSRQPLHACDTVMTKIGRPTRLIAYDTDEAIMAREVGQTPTYKPIRARTILYAAIIALVGGAMVYQLATRAFLGMSLLHDRTPLFVTLRDGSIRNTYTVRLINKRTESRQIALTIDGPTSVAMEVQGATATSDWRPIITVNPDTTQEVRVLVTIPRSSLQSGSNMIRIKASDLFAGETVTIAENFFAP